jgi:negative regulator of flagellin synthesis FlgM
VFDLPFGDCVVTNKIDGYKSSQPLLSSTTKGAKVAAVDKTSGNARSGETADAGGADQLTLTQSARSLQAVAAAVASTPVVDTKKVESARLAISNGTYKVDSGKIADKILQYEKLLK